MKKTTLRILTAALLCLSAQPAHAQERFKVAMLNAHGLARLALESARMAFQQNPSIEVVELTPAQVRAGRLENEGFDALFVSGGRSTTQGRDLGQAGRRAIRRFVHNGGGYVGICAGSYLSLNPWGHSIRPNSPDRGRLAIVDATIVGSGWQRGVETAWFTPVYHNATPALASRVDLHYANGPVFNLLSSRRMPAVVSLATFEGDLAWPEYGTRHGETPGAPAIVASSYGAGRILLFSPNPQIDGPSGPARSEMVDQALRWVSQGGAVPPTLGYEDVFTQP